MRPDPLRDLCPRAVVVWRADAARCSVCNRLVNRPTVAHAWRHSDMLERYIRARLEERLEELADSIEAAYNAELDRLLEPAEPTHRLEGTIPLGDEVLAPDARITVAPGAGVWLGEGPDRVRIGDLVDATLTPDGITADLEVDRYAFDLLRRGHNLEPEAVRKHDDAGGAARLRADAARALGLDPDLEAITGLATTPTDTEEP